MCVSCLWNEWILCLDLGLIQYIYIKCHIWKNMKSQTPTYSRYCSLFLGVKVLTGLCPLPLAPVPLGVCFQSNDSFLHACFPFSSALYFFSQHNTSYIIWEFHTMHPGHTFFPSLPSHKKKKKKEKIRAACSHWSSINACRLPTEKARR